MRTPIALFSLVLIAACADDDRSGYTQPNTTRTTTTETAPDQTALDQSSAPAELEHVAEVREAILAAPDLSLAARNVQVNTDSGRVTLRGEVETEQERVRVAQIASECVATTSVDNQITVEAP